MSLQTLTLDLAKITAYTPQTPTIRQNDAGESLPIILGRGGEAIDLAKSVVTLYLEKSSGKIIQVSSDSAPEAWTINDDGTMSVVLPPETYQAHGDIKVGYLRIKTGDVVESTSSFSIRVLPAKGSPEADDSYISDAAKIVGDIKSKDAAAQVVLEQTRAKYTELNTATTDAQTAASKANDAAKSATDAAGKATDATADTIEIKKSTEDLLATIPTDPAYKGPKGDKGNTGNQGIQGPKGLDGKSSYTHIAYATSSTGDGFSQTPTATTTYVGMYVDSASTDSTDPSKYKWTLIKGADGSQGTPGKPGTDGKTPYLHTAYSWSADGTDRFMTVYPGENLASGTDLEYAMGYGSPTTSWKDGYAYLKLPTNVISAEIMPQYPHTFWYTMTQGATYTQTIWFETDATVKDLSAAQITWWSQPGHDVQPARVKKLGQNSYKVVSIYTWPGKSDNNVRLFDIKKLNYAFDLSTGTYLKFGKLKLEQGDVSTPWAPSPLDDPEGAYPQFIGTYTDYIADDSTDPSKYTWAKLRGEQGPKGDTGSGLELKGTTPPEVGEKDGDTYLVDGRLVVWQDGKWADGGQVQGPKGDQGDTPELTGVVRSATVNGGEQVAPDDAGNLALTTPDPDLSGLATKEAVTTGINAAKEYTDQQIVGLSKSWIGTLSEYQALESYDDLTTYYVISGYEVIVK